MKSRKVIITGYLCLIVGTSLAVLPPDEDFDFDGWTNIEELSMGTNPSNSVSFPRPAWDVDFTYYDSVEDYFNKPLIVYSYSEATSTNKMGGRFDGVWNDDSKIQESATFDSEGRVTLASAPIAPRTIRIAGHRHDVCDVPIDNRTGYLWCYYSGAPKIDYQTGVITRGPHGVSLSASYETTTASSVHLRSGWNRFFGFIDLNNNGTYDHLEPAGLSVQLPMLVSTNGVRVEIPLTDYLVGYPRLSWPALTNSLPYNGARYYSVQITAAGGGSPVTVNIDKPRTFMHEGDFMAAGIDAVDFGAAIEATYEYVVIDGTNIVKTGLFYYNLGNDSNRKKQIAISPVSNEAVLASNIEFKWKMDYRTLGVRISIKNTATDVTYFDELINFPVRHGTIANDNYYYSTIPQKVNGKTTFTLPPGPYTYTIKEFIRTTSGSLTKQSITDTFTVVAD